MRCDTGCRKWGWRAEVYDREVEHDPELLASLKPAREDIGARRVFSHDEVLDWHRNYAK
jgi:hypothetical protein